MFVCLFRVITTINKFLPHIASTRGHVNGNVFSVRYGLNYICDLGQSSVGSDNDNVVCGPPYLNVAYILHSDMRECFAFLYDVMEVKVSERSSSARTHCTHIYSPKKGNSKMIRLRNTAVSFLKESGGNSSVSYEFHAVFLLHLLCCFVYL